MRGKLKHIVLPSLCAAAFFAASFPLNEWFAQTMLRHQLLQLPIMLGIGVALGIESKRINIRTAAWGISALIIFMSSLVFWMLPRSIDLAIIYPVFNRLMHVNMIFIGFLSASVLRNIIIEIKIAFLLMISSMLLAAGMALRSFSIVLCSSFTIWQQKETGLYLLIIGTICFLASLATLFKNLGNKDVKRA